MNYRSIATLNRDIRVWSEQLPWDIEVIVGIPRSGLLAANLLALHRNLPLTDIDGLLDSRVISGGGRALHEEDVLSEERNVLVVDDSICSGKQMSSVKERIEASSLQHRIRYAALYVAPGKEDAVDYFYDVIAMPRAFEWNVMHGGHVPESCVDIDGVLCRDPTEEENDDGARYREFLADVPARLVPTGTIGWLVTCRLEKYRALTEAWLEKNGIRCSELVMMDYPDKPSRMAANAYGRYKASVYETTGAVLFVESSLRSAVEIAKLAGKEVLCMETGELVNPDFVARHYSRGRRLMQRVLKKLLKVPMAFRRPFAKAMR